MLDTMSSRELTEWQAFFYLKKQREEQAEKNKPKQGVNRKATLG